MGHADVITKSFMSDKQNFADAFNLAFYIYGYDIRIDPNELQELDSTLSLSIPLPNGETQDFGRQCDVFKRLKLFYDDRHYYLAMMIENQHYVHLGMPLKLLVYQIIDALKQVRDAMKEQKSDSTMSSDEFLSDYPKDFKLRPVIPLVIYFAPKAWTAPMNMSELYGEVPEELLWLLPSMNYLLLCPRNIEDVRFKQMKSKISLALGALKHATSRSSLSNFFKNDHDYDKISRDLCELILANTNYPRLSLELEESNNMYDITHFWDEADQQLRDEGFRAGQNQGFLDGQQQGFLDGQQQGFLDGQQQGFLDGQQQGFLDGQRDGIFKTVKGFMSIGLTNDQIRAATGLSDEEIIQLRETVAKGE